MTDLLTAAGLRDAIDPCSILVRNGITPFVYQAEIMRASPRRALVCWGRQSSKSTTWAAWALHRALYRPGTLTIIASFNHDKAKELLARGMALYEPYEKEFPTLAETSEHVVFRHPDGQKSEIRTIPARPGSGRGPTAHALILDEAAWTTETLLSEILYSLSTTDGPLIALSTPPEQPQGWWWATWTKGGEVDAQEATRLNDGWVRSLIPSTRCPLIRQDFLDGALEIDGPLRFAREVMCEFPTLSSFSGDRPISKDLIDAIEQVPAEAFDGQTGGEAFP